MCSLSYANHILTKVLKVNQWQGKKKCGQEKQSQIMSSLVSPSEES